MSERSSAERKLPAGLAGYPESVSMKPLSVIVLSPNEEGRRALATALHGTQAQLLCGSGFPPRDGLGKILEGACDVLIVDMNRDTERALELVEAACGLRSDITVIVYSRRADPDLVVRCMRAGAREFLNDPSSPSAIAEAMVRASIRRDDMNVHRKATGKLLAFVGAKGGSGTTTVAANFAVALAKESGEHVALVDLNLQLGDAALTLGLTSEFSTLAALHNESRLDSDLLSKLLVRHSSGLQVLAAPDYLASGGEAAQLRPDTAAVMKMIGILRGDFAWVVVDAGCHYAGCAPDLFEAAEKVYLVSQVSVPELRNCHRIITAHFAGKSGGKLEVVLNRFALRAGEIDEQSIARALMVPSLANNWKIPNDFQVVRTAQNAAAALALSDSPVTRVLTNMARTVSGKTAVEVKKRRFGLF